MTRRAALIGLALALPLAAAAAPALAGEEPITGAPGWVLLPNLGGSGRCSAHDAGPQIDTMLMLSDSGVPILVPGRPDWHFDPKKIAATVSIDGAAPVPLDGDVLFNIALFPIKDGATQASLRGAKTLDWHLPFGDFHAEVEGLGTALDAMRACNPP